MEERKVKKFDSKFLILVLVLILFLILLFFVFVSEKKISGRVISNISLNNNQFSGNSLMSGNLNIPFSQGDLIPASTEIKLKIQKINCKDFYVCSDGNLIPWQTYNTETRTCINAENWARGPWEKCPANKLYEEYFCDEFEDGNGNSLPCCNSGGLGDYYGNLKCEGNVECWSSCATTTSITLQETASLSTTPTKGNLTQGNFRNIGGASISGTGTGYGACSEESIRGVTGQTITGKGTSGGCTDTDGGNDYSVKGTCTGIDFIPNTDYCQSDSSFNLNEYSCDSTNTICESEITPCPYGCSNGKCLDAPEPPPIQTCSDGTSYGSCSSIKPLYCNNGVLTNNCSTCGCDAISVCEPTSNNCVAPSGGGGSQPQEPLGNQTGDNTTKCTTSWSCTSWNPQICPQNQTQTRKCTDQNNCGTTTNKPNETKSCTYISPENSCTGWNNVYSIDLTRITDLKTPNKAGTYNLSSILTYNETNLFSSSSLFSVTGLSSQEDEENIEEENIIRCEENWICEEWEECIEGKETRVCEDTNLCGTEYLKPTTEKSCGEECEPKIACTNWNPCEIEDTQSRTCKDKNLCGASNENYEESRICCAENWKISWGECINGTQKKIYTDSNNCGTAFIKPETEERTCRTGFSLNSKQQNIIFIIVASLVVGFLMIKLLGKILSAKKKSKFTRHKPHKKARSQKRKIHSRNKKRR